VASEAEVHFLHYFLGQTGHELKTVLRFFYPNVRDGDIVRVIFFSFLSPLP
jgi:hypothetical protein